MEGKENILLKDREGLLKQLGIDMKLTEMAKNVGKDVEDYKKQVNNDMVNQIANELLMKKLLNFLHENNVSELRYVFD